MNLAPERISLVLLACACALASCGGAATPLPVGLKPATPWVPCNASTGICFSESLGSHMVLQQAPAKACVYGMLGAGGTSATVKISSSSSSSSSIPYELEVAAEVTAGGHWKACLAPQKVGGDYSITASSNAKATARIEHVTFGDVFYCSGQSLGSRIWGRIVFRPQKKHACSYFHLKFDAIYFCHENHRLCL